jgi:hypothetical protein
MRYFIRRIVLALAVLMLLLVSTSRAQCNFIEVWVDPDQGLDVLPPTPPPGNPVEPIPVQINNPLSPTKTIQFAIDIAFKHLREHYDAQANPDQQAVIHLMPGLYAPDSIGGNGERFPIVMRDRVHLRGVGARRCVIRGVPVDYNPPGYHGYDDNLVNIFLPTGLGLSSTSDDYYDKEVLVDFSLSSRFSVDFSLPYTQVAPWACNQDYLETMELVDGVTFQGGDVQVRFGFDPELPVPLAGRISNCLFDMRNGYAVRTQAEPPSTITVTGPRVGILMTKTWIDAELSSLPITGEGYLDQKIHVTGNTIVMAEYLEPGGWSYRSTAGAAAVVDATYPVWAGNGTADPDPTYRGLGHSGIQNNIFRTYTGGADTELINMAMVGISADDVLVSGSPTSDTNAYSRDRCGGASTNPASAEESLVSLPVSPVQTGLVNFGALCSPSVVINEPLWYANSQSAAPAPSQPSVPLWGGNSSIQGAQYDPVFVGEYLRTVSPAQTDLPRGIRTPKIARMRKDVRHAETETTRVHPRAEGRRGSHGP